MLPAQSFPAPTLYNMGREAEKRTFLPVWTMAAAIHKANPAHDFFVLCCERWWKGLRFGKSRRFAPRSPRDLHTILQHRSRQIWSAKAPTKAQVLLIDLTARYISVASFSLLSLFLLPLCLLAPPAFIPLSRDESSLFVSTQPAMPPSHFPGFGVLWLCIWTWPNRPTRQWLCHCS